MNEAEVIGIKMVNTSSGERTIYTLKLLTSSQEFEEWGRVGFSPKKGELLQAHVIVYARAYLDKQGRPRVKNTVGVNWVSSKK